MVGFAGRAGSAAARKGSGRLRISLVAPHFAEYACRLALSLAEAHDVQLHLFAPNAERELTPALRARIADRVDARWHPRPTRRAMVSHGARLAATIARFRPDITHAQEAAGWTLLVARTWLRPLGAPFALTVHDPAPHRGRDRDARARTAWADRRLRYGADAVIVHGASLIAPMAAAHPGLAGRIHALNHGVLGDFAEPSPAADEAVFLFFGRVEAYKGLGVLLDAGDLLAREPWEFRLRVVGMGSDLDRHRERFAKSPFATLEERFVPAVEVPDVFGSAGAVVLPYLEGTQSGVAALAFAAGRPVIASSVGAIPDIVEDGVNGLLVPPDDPRALALAMRRMLAEPGLRARLARGAAATAAGALAWEAIARATAEVYARAIGR
jgi:glycosyltransferase involved in cell wall biosynthesis